MGPNDTCPTKPVSVSIALADKIDSLVGFYIAGERATGSGDQFGLRRSALGIIRIIIENGLNFNLSSLFFLSVKTYLDQGVESDKDSICNEVQSFVESRLVPFLKNKGVKHDTISASMPFLKVDNLNIVLARVDAVGSFVASDSAIDLLGGYKRASNILSIEEKKDSLVYNKDPSFELFESKEESRLYDILEEVSKNNLDHISKGNFNNSMKELSKLKNPIDNFFEYVKVNSSDKLVRKNRLELLAKIRETFNKVADFSKIEGA